MAIDFGKHFVSLKKIVSSQWIIRSGKSNVQLNHAFAYFHRSYRSRVIQNTKESVYQAQGGFTYFIPVEEGFKVNS